MPIKIFDSKDGRGKIVVGSGVVTNQEYLDTFTRHLMQESTDSSNHIYTLVDWSAVSKVEVASSSIRLIADIMKKAAKTHPETIIGSVAVKDEIYGLARMSDVYKEHAGWQSEVFRSRPAAETWIRQTVKTKHGIDDLAFS